MVCGPEYIYDFRLTESNFRRLYLDYYPSLVIFARKVLKQEVGAEDLVQDVFIRTWEARQMSPSIDNVAVYLYRAVKYRCLNELRDRETHRSIEQKAYQWDDECIEMLYTEQETLRRVNELIMQLPPRCKEIFVKSIDGFSNKEIAEQMHISEETVKKQNHLARKFIKEKIGDLLLLFFIFRNRLFFR